MRNCSALYDNYENNSANSIFTSPSDFVLYGFSLCMFVLTMYILFVLILFVSMNGFEEKSYKKKQFTSKIFSRKSTSIDGAIIQTRRIFRTLMFSMCICVSMLLAGQFIIEQVLIVNKFAYGGALQLGFKYVYGLQIVLGYVFMWIRQRLFYYGSSPLRNLLRRNTALLAMSSMSLIFVVANVIIQMSLAWYWNACTVLFEAVTWLVLCLFVQGTLIGLFLYPLWSLTRERKRFLKSTKGNGRFFSSTNVNGLIRRCLIVTSLYFTTDLSITIAIIAKEASQTTPFQPLVLMFLQNLNSFSNISCLICSFRNWKTILFPWKKMNLMRRQLTVQSPSTVASLSMYS